MVEVAKKIEELPICELRTFFRGPQHIIYIEEIDTGKVHLTGDANVPVQGGGATNVRFDYPDDMPIPKDTLGKVDVPALIRDAVSKFDGLLKQEIARINAENEKAKQQGPNAEIVVPGMNFDMSKLLNPRAGGNGRHGRRL